MMIINHIQINLFGSLLTKLTVIYNIMLNSNSMINIISDVSAFISKDILLYLLFYNF